MARTPDGCLVPTGPLADALDRFFAQWKSERPARGGQFQSDPDEARPLRALEWLATNAKMRYSRDDPWICVSESTIQNIVERRYRTTEYRIADALVTALDRVEMFYDGTLPVSPNPSASAAARAECCAGSTTDTSSGSSASVYA